MDWQKVKNQFEKEISVKLLQLPGHREVPQELFDFRGLISHEIPETAPAEVFLVPNLQGVPASHLL